MIQELEVCSEAVLDVGYASTFAGPESSYSDPIVGSVLATGRSVEVKYIGFLDQNSYSSFDRMILIRKGLLKRHFPFHGIQVLQMLNDLVV